MPKQTQVKKSYHSYLSGTVLKEAIRKQTELQDEKVQADLVSINNGHASSVIDTRELYQEALKYYSANNKPLATQTLWQAFICGEGQAAYDLFQLFYNGDGIQQNQNIGVIMLGVAYSIQDKRAEQHKRQISISSDQDAISGILLIAHKQANKKYASHKVTPEIITFQSEQFTEILRKKDEYFKVDMFHNTITDYMTEYYEMPIMGESYDDSSSYDGTSCVIL